MTEADVVSELVEFTNVLLAGISVFFTVVSAYVAALNYFIGTAGVMARGFAFGFVSLVLAMLVAVLYGARRVHNGLTERLGELDAQGGLTAAGAGVFQNASREFVIAGRYALSLDELVMLAVLVAVGLVYAGLFYLTFAHRWRRASPGAAQHLA